MRLVRTILNEDVKDDRVGQNLQMLQVETRYLFNSMNYNMYVDPRIIMQIVQAGVALYEMFNKDEDSIDNIGEWILTLRRELEQINGILIEIHNELKILKLHIDEVQLKDVESNLLSSLDTYKQHVFNLKEHPDDERLIDIFRNLYFQQISISSNKLKRYSFTSIFTLGYCMKIELELITILSLSNTSKEQVLDDYLDYFTRCLDDKIVGSLGNIIKATENSVIDLRKSYYDGRSWYATSTYNTDCHKEFEGRSRPTTCRIIQANVNYKITGSLENGFSGSIVGTSNEVLLRVGSPDAYTGGKEYMIEKIRINNLQKRIDEANSYVPIYKSLTENLNLLNKVKEVCGNLLEEIKERKRV